MKKWFGFFIILAGLFFFFATRDMAPEPRDAFKVIEVTETANG